MKIIINRNSLLGGLQETQGPTTTKINFPILNGVLLSAENNTMRFTATDIDITIISFQQAKVITEGKVVIPMGRFISIIRELPPGEITLETTQGNLLIKCEKIEFKLSTFNKDEFPKIEEEKEVSLIKISSQELKEMIELTAFCVGYDDVNYILNGIFFEIFQNEIRLVSSDSKRLSFIKRKLPPSQPEINTKISFTLPIKAINELYKIIKDRDEEICLFKKENKVGFDLKDTQFIARPLEGEFFNYSQYIPQESKDKIVINRRNFFSALKRANLLSTLDYQGVKLEFKKDKVNISKNTPQLGEVKETVEVQYNGSSWELGFNPQYIMDVLKNLADEEVCFELFGADKPVVLRKKDYVYLMLPMTI